MFYEKLAGTVDTFRAASGIARPKGVPTLSTTPKMPKPLTSKSNTPAVSTTINKNQVNSDVKNVTAVKTAARYHRMLRRANKHLHDFTDSNSPHTPGDEIFDTYNQAADLYSRVEKRRNRKNRGGATVSETLNKLKEASIVGNVGRIFKAVGGMAKQTVKDVDQHGLTVGKHQISGKTVRNTASNIGKGTVGTMAAYGGYKALSSDDRNKTAADLNKTERSAAYVGILSSGLAANSAARKYTAAKSVLEDLKAEGHFLRNKTDEVLHARDMKSAQKAFNAAKRQRNVAIGFAAAAPAAVLAYKHFKKKEAFNKEFAADMIKGRKGAPATGDSIAKTFWMNNKPSEGIGNTANRLKHLYATLKPENLKPMKSGTRVLEGADTGTQLRKLLRDVNK